MPELSFLLLVECDSFDSLFPPLFLLQADRLRNSEASLYSLYNTIGTYRENQQTSLDLFLILLCLSSSNELEIANLHKELRPHILRKSLSLKFEREQNESVGIRQKFLTLRSVWI
ncbi:hypothetical protein MKW98_001411 [Papaver atlanticum]|uniref:Uncharacterized protein n=1 Tax=Papaver atlanticum TaxID=357466 RepID=A0AAD4XPS5_9MAGN|nr:hypothetical protein MKW98_001411 [Papaver atlanticum]